MKAIFLDRDGIINKPIVRDNKPYPPQSLKELEFVEGIEDFLAKMKVFGYYLFIVTNQPDVARGTQKKEVIEEIHKYILDNLDIDKIYVCYHDNQDKCNCRKPKNGMILQAQKEFDLDLSQCWMIGDRSSDITCGEISGCRTIFYQYNYEESSFSIPDYIIENISQAKEIIK